MNKSLCSLFLLFILFSCGSKKELIYKRLIGQWAIEEIKYMGKSYKDQMYSNAFALREKNEISIPETFHFKLDREAKWELIEDKLNKDFFVKIETSNTVFNDTFRVRFIEDREKMLRGVELKSEIIYIKAFKLLQNFNNW